MNKELIQVQPRGASELIEVPIANAAAGQVNLPDVPQLRNQGDEVVVIKAMRVISPKVLSHGPTTGTATTPLADLRKISLILYCEGWEKGHLIPALVLNDANDSDATTATTIPFRTESTDLDNWKDVDWNKSKLQFSNGQTASIASTFLIEVQYQRYLRKDGQLIRIK